MGSYLVVPLDLGQDYFMRQFVETVQQHIPGWQPQVGDPMTALGEGMAVMLDTATSTATRVGEEIVRWQGRSVDGIEPIDDTPAYGEVALTARAGQGGTAAEGTELSATNPAGEQIGLRTLAPLTLAAGATGTVAVEAIEPGEAGNDVAGPAELQQYLDFLDGAAVTISTAGGRDAETDEAYLDRYVEERRLSSPRPIRARDWPRLALRVPGVARATAIDLLDPTTGITDAERHVTVVLADETGGLPAAPVVTQARDYLTGLLIEGAVLHLIGPTVVDVDFAFDAVALPGWDPAGVHENIVARLRAWASPATWGTPDDIGETSEWLNEPVVRYLEAAEQVQRVAGVRYVETVSINGRSSQNVTLGGYAPLPQARNVTGTVTTS